MNKYQKNFAETSCLSNENGTNRELMEKIRSLSFVAQELELYLDTHPTCKVALDYYYQTVDALKKLKDEYQAKYGPIVASGCMGNEEWSWVKEPWPWHRDADIMNGSWMGERK